jgi:hypothetical protein
MKSKIICYPNINDISFPFHCVYEKAFDLVGRVDGRIADRKFVACSVARSSGGFLRIQDMNAHGVNRLLRRFK